MSEADRSLEAGVSSQVPTEYVLLGEPHDRDFAVDG